jgi:hypothetical protein
MHRHPITREKALLLCRAGHLLGFYDEYVGGAVGTAPRWKAPNNTAVMSSGLDVPYEYYWDFRDWFKAKTGESWDGIK